MNALMWPTEPRTTMSTPFIEIPQRAAALPSIDEQAAVAGRAGRLARVARRRRRVPDIMFSATPGARVAVRRAPSACLFMPAQ